jgi:FkbM family methyltransferase
MKKILFIVPHLSTGGLPQVTTNKIQLLKDDYVIKCVEYGCYSWDFVVQKNRIKNLIGEDNLITLWDDKNVLIDVINDFQPDIISMEEFPEFFMDNNITKQIYRQNRPYKIFETTHDSSFKPTSKVWFPDKFIFVSVFNAIQYSMFDIPYEVIEYPIENREKRKELFQEKLGLDKGWKHVVNVGLFTERKNQKYIFEIARKLENSKIKFHFIGNQADNFKSYWEPLMNNKPENCIVWGEKDNVNEFLEASDLFMFPSKGDRNNKELNPIAIKEAIEYGIPMMMYNLDVYCGKYDKLPQVTFLTGDIDKDVNNMMDVLNVGGIDSLFNLGFNGDNNQITITYNGNQKFDFNVSIRDMTSKAPMYWFNLPLEYPIFYWTIPIPIHIKKFKDNTNFRGFLVEFYDSQTNELVFGQELIVNPNFYPRIPEFKFKPLDCNYINYYEFFVDRCFDDLKLENLDTVIDIGANVGLFAKYMYSVNAKKVILVEANPYLRESIEYHLDNDLEKSVIYMNPVYKENTKIDFMFSKENSTIGSNVLNVDGQLNNVVSCDTIIIDDIYKDNNYGRISLFKCDIEGGEYPLFESITDEQINLVDRFMIEFHENTNGKINIIIDKLKKNNFECEIIVFDGSKKTKSDKNINHGVIFAKPRILELIKQDNNISDFSQNNEQEIILSFFDGEDPKTNKFLDIGANDGKTFSNTYALALLGWDGVCIEPTQTAFLKLQNLYKNNKNIKCINAGISNKTNVINIYESLNWNVSEAPPGILSTLHAENKERFDGMSWKENQIIVYNYNDIVNYYDLEKDTYDFINIDVEGHELIVIDEIQNKLKKCRLLCVEKTNDENSNQKIVQKLYEFGFTITHTTIDNYIAKKIK